MPFKDFVGEVLTSADVDAYLMQGILVFADTTERDTDLASYLEEGRFCYTEDTDSIYYYDGSAWVTYSSPWTTFTPSFTNLTLGAATTDCSYRYQSGDFRVRVLITCAADTVPAGTITMNIPNSVTADSGGGMGVGVIYDDSASRPYPLLVDVLPASGVLTFYFMNENTSGNWDATAPITVVTDDRIRIDVTIPVA